MMSRSFSSNRLQQRDVPKAENSASGLPGIKGVVCCAKDTAERVVDTKSKAMDALCGRHSASTAGRRCNFAQHAAEGMVNHRRKRCRREGCSKCPSFGIAGSKTPQFCAQHAAEGMVNVTSKRCRHDGCSKNPSFGIAGSKSLIFCAQHAPEGMVNIKSKRCRYEGCSKYPTFGIAGSKSRTFCALHASKGMVDVTRKRCRYEGCSKCPSFGIAGSKTAQFCSQHAAEDMVDVTSKRCRHEGCSKRLSSSIDGIKTEEVCALHASERVEIKPGCGILDGTSTLSIPVGKKGNGSKRYRTNSSKEALGTTNDDHVKVELKLEN